MASKLSDDVIAQILAETEMFPDDRVAERWGISPRTIYRYKRRRIDEPELAAKVREKSKELESCWTQDIARNIRRALAALERRYDTARSRDDAECIKAIADSLRAVGELKLGHDAMNEDDD